MYLNNWDTSIYIFKSCVFMCTGTVLIYCACTVCFPIHILYCIHCTCKFNTHLRLRCTFHGLAKFVAELERHQFSPYFFLKILYVIIWNLLSLLVGCVPPEHTEVWSRIRLDETHAWVWARPDGNTTATDPFLLVPVPFTSHHKKKTREHCHKSDHTSSWALTSDELDSENWWLKTDQITTSVLVYHFR